MLIVERKGVCYYLYMALEEIRSERIKKLERLEKAGIDIFPASVSKSREEIGAVLKNFAKRIRLTPRLRSGGKRGVVVAGRLFAKREHGGSCFGDLKDASGKIQVFFKEDVLGKDSYDLFIRDIDIGDFLEVSGKPFVTKRGEQTIEVLEWRILAKSLRPLPEKWHGLQDVEERFRKRYLDLLMNEEVRQKFLARSRIIRDLRGFLEKNGFEEFETPMLQSIPGGALAKPFKTHHNALDVDLYLRIAPELYLKRLLVGGFEKVYELGRDFRNEGIDVTHNPEFTMLEVYAAWWDENDMMKFVEEMFLNAVAKIFKKKEFEYDGSKVAIKAPFPRVTFADLLKKYALIVDYDAETRDSMALIARRFGLDVEKHESKGKIADEIYKKICRPHLKNPVFVVSHPLDISPLAKKISKNSNNVRRFQLIVGGLEIANGFSELNDPIDQKARFEEQEKMRGGGSPSQILHGKTWEGEEEAHPMDEDFVEALEYGMPPAAGLGVGIDRLIMLLTNTHNVKEIILFPTMRSK